MAMVMVMMPALVSWPLKKHEILNRQNMHISTLSYQYTHDVAYYQENCSKHDSFHFHIKVHGNCEDEN